MKKLVLLFSLGIFFSFASLSFAQSIQVHDKSGNDVSGTVINIWGDSAYAVQMALPLDVKNISGTTINVKAKKIENSMLPGSSSTICFNGQCYISTVFVSPTAASIAAGANDTTFAGDYRPKGNLGTSIITYVFFKTDDVNDSAWVEAHFNSTPAGLEHYSNAIFEISNPYPNPASSKTTFNYSFPENSKPTFTLSDIAGNKIQDIAIYNTIGVLDIPVSSLSEGIYFYSFYLDGTRLMTKKLIVQK